MCTLCDPPRFRCRLQKEKQQAEAAAQEGQGKALAEVEALRQDAAAAEQQLQAAKVRR